MIDRLAFLNLLCKTYPDLFVIIGAIAFGEAGSYMTNVGWYKELCTIVDFPCPFNRISPYDNDYNPLWVHIISNEDLHSFWLL